METNERSRPGLFSPWTLGPCTVRNRIVRSATAENLADENGTPAARLVALVRRLAEGGVGLIVTGHAFVDAGGRCHAEMTGLHEDRLVEPFRALADAAHAGGARIAVQLNHGGRACDPRLVPDPAAPSAVAVEGRDRPPREMTRDEIAAVVAAFGRAAGRAKAAGLDAVQIHGAHGYLVSQFLSPRTNRREDGYGGSLEHRARFLREVAAAVRAAVGPEYPVWVKLGVEEREEGGLTLDEGAALASWLEDFGLDAVETSTAGAGAIVARVTRPDREGYLRPLARAVVARTRLPVVLVGGLRSRAVMEAALDEGIAAVSLSRPLIREPDLPSRLETGAAEKAACISCNRCWPKERGLGIACRAKR